MKNIKTLLITDFETPAFQLAFREYFRELGISVNDWDGLFCEMNAEKMNYAYLRVNDNSTVVGFIQFCPITMESWFFHEKCGFIREFWIAPSYRKQGHGTDLLHMAEVWFEKNDIRKILLTTETAHRFYEKEGYCKAIDVIAMNKDDVYMKIL